MSGATSGRKSWIGIAKETTPGVPVTPSTYIPFNSNTLLGKHEPVGDDEAFGVRDAEFGSSVKGKRFGEGEIGILAESVNVGYLIGGAFGTFGSPSDLGNGVYRHEFTRNNSDTPQTFSITNDRSIDRELYTYAVINQFNLNFADGEAHANATIMSRFPVTTASGTLTLVSGVFFTFRNAQVQLGANLSAAQSAAKTEVENLTFNINNNAEMIYRSAVVDGSRSDPGDVSLIAMGKFEVSGEITLLFENTTQRDNYYNLSKQALVLSLVTDRDIGGGENDKLEIQVPKLRIQERSMETGIDDFFSETLSFIGEYDSVQSMTAKAILTNRKASYG